MSTPHTRCPRGKRVVILLRSGERIEDVFRERKRKFLVFQSGLKLLAGDVRAMVIARGG